MGGTMRYDNVCTWKLEGECICKAFFSVSQATYIIERERERERDFENIVLSLFVVLPNYLRERERFQQQQQQQQQQKRCVVRESLSVYDSPRLRFEGAI